VLSVLVIVLVLPIAYVFLERRRAVHQAAALG
jgi:hypothetical protein